MKNPILSGLAGLLLLSTLSSNAESVGLEVSPLVGGRFGGSFENDVGDAFDLKAGLSYGVVVDFAPGDSEIKYEVLWSRQTSGIDFDGYSGLDHLDVTVDQFMFGGIYETTEGRFRENISALAGASMFTPEGRDSEVFFSASLGFGGKYYATKNLLFRVDIRGYCNVIDSQGAFISSGGTTVIYFSGDALFQGEVTVGVSLSF